MQTGMGLLSLTRASSRHALRVQGNFLDQIFCREVIFEVATGGAGELLSKLSVKNWMLCMQLQFLLHHSLFEGSEEHILENFHSSRTIRKLVLDYPPFASTL